MNDDINREIWSHFKDMQTVFLATSDHGQPRVRPVTMLHYNNKLWIGTGAGDAKTKQVKKNNKAEFCLYIEEGDQKQGYIRGTCMIDIIEDEGIKKELSEQMPYFKYFWKGYDDPKYTLFRFDLKEIEYLRPGSFKVARLSL